MTVDQDLQELVCSVSRRQMQAAHFGIDEPLFYVQVHDAERLLNEAKEIERLTRDRDERTDAARKLLASSEHSQQYWLGVYPWLKEE